MMNQPIGYAAGNATEMHTEALGRLRIPIGGSRNEEQIHPCIKISVSKNSRAIQIEEVVTATDASLPSSPYELCRQVITNCPLLNHFTWDACPRCGQFQCLLEIKTGRNYGCA